jgi:hypothetical protein
VLLERRIERRIEAAVVSERFISATGRSGRGESRERERGRAGGIRKERNAEWRGKGFSNAIEQCSNRDRRSSSGREEHPATDYFCSSSLPADYQPQGSILCLLRPFLLGLCSVILLLETLS